MILMPVEDLKPGMKLGQDIFTTEDSVSPFIRNGALLSDYIIKRLERQGVSDVYIDIDRPRTLYETDITPESPAIDENLRDEALESLENIFATASAAGTETGAIPSPSTAQVDNVVSKMVGSLLSDSTTLVNISNLRSYDDYTFHHSLSVTVLSIAIAQEMGMKEEELNRIGACAMMHDIGKTAIPIEIIRKPSRLDDHEYKLIKTHSSVGYKYLTKTEIGDEKMWHGVLHHHEKMDGSGYPDGLSMERIPIWSRIISVADVYDALTSDRPYRTPMQPMDAVEYVMGGIGTSFDYDAVAALVKKVDLYPIGSFLELSDGRFVVVVDNGNSMRPLVKVLDSDEYIDLYHDRKALSLVIKRMVTEFAYH